MTTLTLIGKPDCHLCDVAHEVVEPVVAESARRGRRSIECESPRSLDDPALYELWWEKIPVVLIDGALHAHWRVSPERLRAALTPLTSAHRRR